jgi:S-adenosylmethionine hydrolase
MPILTLTTDIGQQDYLVGAIKGQFLQADAGISIVDVTHYLSPFNYLHAAYVCSSFIKQYPANSFHLVILNLFDAASTGMLLAKHNDQFIACPNNGILTMITNAKPKEIVVLPSQKDSGGGLLAYTKTVANAFAALYKGESLQNIAEPVKDLVEKYPLRSMLGADWMEGQIIFIDNFENVIINITKEEFEEHRKGRSFKILFSSREVIETISNNYADANEGELVAWFNSAGYLELAMNKGNMAGLFGLQGFSEKMNKGTAMQNKWFYQTVKIFFE